MPAARYEDRAQAAADPRPRRCEDRSRYRPKGRRRQSIVPDVVELVREFDAGRDAEPGDEIQPHASRCIRLHARGTCHRFHVARTPAGRCRAAVAPAACRLPPAACRLPPAAWACGDLRLGNFGSCKRDNRQVYFDIVDFDEAGLAPVSWDAVRWLAGLRVGRDLMGVDAAAASALGGTFVDRYAVLIEGQGSPDGNHLLDLKRSLPSSQAGRAPVAQPDWLDEAQRVVAVQQRMQAVPAASLQRVALDGIAYVLRGLQPGEDRVDPPDRKAATPASLVNLMAMTARCLAWAQLRSSGRSGSASADALIDLRPAAGDEAHAAADRRPCAQRGSRKTGKSTRRPSTRARSRSDAARARRKRGSIRHTTRRSPALRSRQGDLAHIPIPAHPRHAYSRRTDEHRRRASARRDPGRRPRRPDLKKMFIGGQWLAARDGRTLPVVAPADGETFDQIACGGAHEVDLAVRGGARSARRPLGPPDRHRARPPADGRSARRCSTTPRSSPRSRRATPASRWPPRATTSSCWRATSSSTARRPTRCTARRSPSSPATRSACCASRSA